MFSRLVIIASTINDDIRSSLIQLVVFSIFIPILIWIYTTVRRLRERYATRFFGFQDIHACVDVLLSVEKANVFEEMAKAMHDESGLSIFNHFVYGNLDNKIFVVKRLITNGTLRRRLQAIGEQDLQEYLAECDKCLFELDRNLVAATSLSFLAEPFILLRFRMLGFRHFLNTFRESLVESSGLIDFRRSDLETYCRILICDLEHIFIELKRPTDRALMLRQIGMHAALVLRFFFTLPFELASGNVYRKRKRQMELQSRFYNGGLSLADLSEMVSDKASVAAVAAVMSYGIQSAQKKRGERDDENHGSEAKGCDRTDVGGSADASKSS